MEPDGQRENIGPDRAGSQVVEVFAAAARTTVELLGRIDPAGWERPGLGEWDLRALIGHTSRSLRTVVDYLNQPRDNCDIDSAAGYLTALTSVDLDTRAVVERGRRAGQDLGSDPAAAFGALAERAIAAAARAPLDAVITTIFGGMRVGDYLPTRTFELVVHGLDISAATGIPVHYPAPGLACAVDLAVCAALRADRGAELLRVLTGRADRLGFSVV